MSRYKVESKIPGYDALVGWDNPCQTFFAFISENPKGLGPNDEPDIKLLVGSLPGDDCQDIGELVDRTFDYMSISRKVLEGLDSDFYHKTEPTPTQKFNNMFFRNLV